MANIFHINLRSLIDFCFPRFCTMCEQRLALSEQHLCARCLSTLNRIEYEGGERHGYIERLFWGQIPIVRATSMFLYEGEQTRKLLHNIKYFDRPEIATFLAGMFVIENKHTDFFEGVDVIVPVPLAKKKLRKRGYNQCDFIAKGIAAETGMPVVDDAVERIVNNPTQTHLSPEQRKENVKDVFKIVNTQKIADKHVLLIDDVITTGATILSCAKEIAKAPNVKISIFSLAFAGELVKASLPLSNS